MRLRACPQGAGVGAGSTFPGRRVMAAGQGFVAVVGARVLPEAVAPQVADVVRCFVSRGWGIGSGGARGADAYVLNAVLAAGPSACARSVVFLPGAMPTGANTLDAFAGRGGRVVPGVGGGRVALLRRSRRLARASAGVVAFLWGPSRGSVFTVRQAVRSGKPAAVVLAGGGAELPAFTGGRWEACTFGGVAAFRWVREPRAPEVESAEPKRTALHRIFVVPDGEPVDALLTHISGLTQGERLWFEQGVLAGEAVLVPHEALSDTPAWLAVPRLRRRFGCGVREVAGLAELFIGLDAGPDVVAWYEAEARRRGVAGVIEDLVYLVAQLAIAEAVPDSDAFDEAERLGDYAEAVDGDGVVGQLPEESGVERAWVAWHALGSVQPEGVECPGKVSRSRRTSHHWLGSSSSAVGASALAARGVPITSRSRRCCRVDSRRALGRLSSLPVVAGLRVRRHGDVVPAVWKDHPPRLCSQPSGWEQHFWE